MSDSRLWGGKSVRRHRDRVNSAHRPRGCHASVAVVFDWRSGATIDNLVLSQEPAIVRGRNYRFRGTDEPRDSAGPARAKIVLSVLPADKCGLSSSGLIDHRVRLGIELCVWCTSALTMKEGCAKPDPAHKAHVGDYRGPRYMLDNIHLQTQHHGSAPARPHRMSHSLCCSLIDRPRRVWLSRLRPTTSSSSIPRVPLTSTAWTASDL